MADPGEQSEGDVDRLVQRRNERKQRALARQRARRRGLVLGAFTAVLVAIAAVLLSSVGSSPRLASHSGARAPRSAAHKSRHVGSGHAHHSQRNRPPADRLPEAAQGVAVPILMYHVINPPIPGAPYPGLYVPKQEFAQQMEALAHAGFYGVTLQQLWRHWQSDAPLPGGRPVVISFDNGYQSQYSNALPILRRLGWKAIENLQLSGLPPSQGGLSEAQVKGLIAAGWELDTQGFSHAELTALSPRELRFQVIDARRALQRRYHVPVRWFCYPSGHYDAEVIATVKEAGFLGSTTVIPGWASPRSDPYTLPRLRVLGGTSGSGLLALIEGSREEPPPPAVYE